MPDPSGCPYCHDIQNRNFGHLTYVAVEDETCIHLVQCPKCGTLYEDNSHGDPTPVTAAEADDRWGFVAE